MKFSSHALKKFMQDILMDEGMSATHAETVARVIDWANLRGADSHGIMRIPQYLNFIGDGDLDPRAEPEMAIDALALIMIEAHKSAGQVALSMAVDEVVDRARHYGLSWGLVRQTTHTGPVGYYAQQIAKNNMIGIVTAATVPLMAYQGSRVENLGTNPLSIAVPAGNDETVLFDMATSVASKGRITQAALKDEEIPAGWALDETGKPATQGKDARVLLPMSGAKGAGLALMLEFLNSVLAGNPIISQMIEPGANRFHNHNASCLAIDIEKIRDARSFKFDADALIQAMVDQPKALGADEIRMPGTKGSRIEQERLRNGVAIADGLWQQLLSIAERKKLTPPVPLSD